MSFLGLVAVELLAAVVVVLALVAIAGDRLEAM